MITRRQGGSDAGILFGMSRKLTMKPTQFAFECDFVSDGPTPEYAQLYRSVNMSLDKMTSQIVQWINEKGSSAKAIPASKSDKCYNLIKNTHENRHYKQLYQY